MRVVLVGDYPPPFGGVAIHVQQVEAVLRQAGVDVRVLDIGKGARPAPDVLSVKSPQALVRALAREARRGTVVHLHTSGNNPKAWAVALAVAGTCRPLGARCVITLHSGLLPAFLAGARHRRILAKVALLGFDQIVAVSPAVKQALVSAGVPAKKVEVVPAFCAAAVQPGQVPDRFEAARTRRSPLLAMAHHPSPVYGRALMFEALASLRARFPKVGLAVFGPGTQDEAFRKDARAHGVAELIEDFGNLEHAQALALMGKCDVFVRPTTADGDAISVREALALGVPCVASDAAARPQGVYTFETGNAQTLVQVIEEAREGGPRLSELADAGPFLLGLYGRLTKKTAGAGEARAPAHTVDETKRRIWGNGEAGLASGGREHAAE